MADELTTNPLSPDVAAAALSAVSPALMTEQPQPAAPASTLSVDSAVTALAALAGVEKEQAFNEIAQAAGMDPDALRQVSQVSGLADIKQLQAGISAFTTAHADTINQHAIDAAYLQTLEADQREAIAEFMEYMGYSVPRRMPDQPAPDARAQSEAIQRAYETAQEETGMDPATMMASSFMRFLLNLFGLGEYADGILNTLGMGSGGRDSIGTRAVGTGPARYGSEAEIEAIIDQTPGEGTIGGVVNLANSLVGFAESGGANCGAIVRATMGWEGSDALWCGGFTRFVFDRMGLAGVYDQADYTMAQSFRREGEEHGAFHNAGSGYIPEVGDVVVFDSSRGPDSGHVGIVTAVAPDGTVTYVSGNSGDQVAARTYNINDPPSLLRGHTDTSALAAAKGIDIGQAQVADIPVPVLEHTTRDR